MLPTNGTAKSAWTQLSDVFADTVADLGNSIVAIDGGGRSTMKGVVCQPDVLHGHRLPADFEGDGVADLVVTDAAGISTCA
jgi:hypothetical protein